MISKMKLDYIVSASQFDKSTIQKIFDLTDSIKLGRYEKKALSGKIMATLFYEPSTRTRLSFESAMLRLGGDVIGTENAAEFSSAVKGETLEDTIRITSSYCDVIVLRHYAIGAAETAIKYTNVPVINAGDGSHEHPTQALLDLYTIFSKFKKPDFTIAMVGDLATYRSVNSLSLLLTLYPKVKFIFVSPKKLSITEELRSRLQKTGNSFAETDQLKTALSRADVVYVTRIQKERLSKSDYDQFFGAYTIDGEALKLMKKDSIIMHPLPRINEIAQEVDSDPRAIYFEEAQNGVFVRMALLLFLFDKV